MDTLYSTDKQVATAMGLRGGDDMRKRATKVEALEKRIAALEVQAQERREVAVVAVKVMVAFANNFSIEVDELNELAERIKAVSTEAEKGENDEKPIFFQKAIGRRTRRNLG